MADPCAGDDCSQPENCPFPSCPLIGTEQTRDRWWQQEVRDAMRQGRIVLYRQRIVTRGRPQRFEVLARLRDRDGDIVPPDDWMPALRSNPDLVEALDWHIAEMVLARALPVKSQVWINFSALSLRPGFSRHLKELMSVYRVTPRQICVEITEQTRLMTNEELRAVRRLGCDVALDDVGEGYSNWANIAESPLSWLKIAGSLIAHVGINHRQALVPKYLIRLGKELRLGVVAEWVETSAQAYQLWNWGVDGMQGFNVPRQGEGVPQAWEPGQDDIFFGPDQD